MSMEHELETGIGFLPSERRDIHFLVKSRELCTVLFAVSSFYLTDGVAVVG